MCVKEEETIKGVKVDTEGVSIKIETEAYNKFPIQGLIVQASRIVEQSGQLSINEGEFIRNVSVTACK